MPHWKSIYIQRFRRIENLRLEDLGTINLLVGPNNSGKTSALEALAIASDPFSPWNWINTAWERELKSARTPVLEVLNWIFPHVQPRENGFEGSTSFKGVLTTGEHIDIETTYREFQEVSLRPSDGPGNEEADDPAEWAAQLAIRLQRSDQEGAVHSEESLTHAFSGGKFAMECYKPALMQHHFVSPVSHRTSRQLLAAVDQVLEERLKEEVIALMRMLADDVDDIEIRSPQGRGAVIHIHHSKLGYVPLAVEGDGMRRALAFASAAALARNGILLLDEVETALHPAALGKIFRFLVQVCRASGVQLFMTTHSLEAVDAMLESVAGDVDDLVAYRLPPRGSNLALKRFGEKTLRDLRQEGGLDIR